MRFFLKLAYNGEHFHGWQKQPNAVSVQETIEKSLSIICRQPIEIVGAGRTDSGVHAYEMYAHFDLSDEPVHKEKFLLSLNRMLGKEISVKDMIRVDDNAHARFDATRRTYKYFVTYEKSPFNFPFSWLSPSHLDMESMNEAAKLLIENKDFTSFAKLHSDAKTNICNVVEAKWQETSDFPDFSPLSNYEGLIFTISADRFLRNMVRAVVGTLVEVGRGKIDINDFRKIIESKDRCVAGMSMPAHALFLWNIKYPYIPHTQTDN